MCRVGEFDCSQESLTSRQALAMLCELQRMNLELYNKITSQEVPTLSGDEEPTFSAHADLSDGTDIPTDILIDHIISDGIQVKAGFVVDAEGLVMRENIAEELEMEVAEDSDEVITMPAQVPEGCGHCMIKKCILFGSNHMWENV